MQRPPKFLKVAYSLCAIVVTGGCLSATFVPTSGAYPARASDCDIKVFSSAVPDRKYEEIGIVEGVGSAWKADLEAVLPKLKEEGCRAGGDALIMQSSDAFSQGRDGIRTQRISATVIRWKTE